MPLNLSPGEKVNVISPALLEMTSGEEETTPSVFWALEPSLPRIAAQAAVEFDWLVQDKQGRPVANASRESISTLSLLLSESLGNTQLDADNKAFVDSGGLNLFAKAYNDSHKTHPVKTREELASAITQLTESLRKARQEGEIQEDVLVRLRAFCVALSEYAAVYRQMIYGNRQEHPYRK